MARTAFDAHCSTCGIRYALNANWSHLDYVIDAMQDVLAGTVSMIA
jgi:hypothetical protein